MKNIKSKALLWLGGIGSNNNNVEQNVTQQIPLVVEDSGIIFQIPQMFLDDPFVAYIKDIIPSFLA